LLIIIFIYLAITQKHFSYYLAAGEVLAAALALFSQARIKPQAVNFHLAEDGIEFSSKKYLWENLKNAFLTATGLGLYIVYHKRDDRGEAKANITFKKRKIISKEIYFGYCKKSRYNWQVNFRSVAL